MCEWWGGVSSFRGRSVWGRSVGNPNPNSRLILYQYCIVGEGLGLSQRVKLDKCRGGEVRKFTSCLAYLRVILVLVRLCLDCKSRGSEPVRVRRIAACDEESSECTYF